MERYYQNGKPATRTDRNKKLYNSIYSYGKYNNIEGIASIDSSNEIDITKVKQMIDNREKYQAERKYRKITKEDVEDLKMPTTEKRYTEDTDRTYDIMDVLNKAKENKEPDDKERVLSKESLDVLNKLNLKKDTKEITDDDIKEMVNTITYSSMLNKMDDQGLAEDMFSDLKGNNDDTKVGDIKDIKDLIEDTQTMDNSFFTSNVKLKKSDFAGYEKKSSPFKTIFLTILILGIIITSCILIAKKLGL